jgi:6-phosphogluconate dehydrogenase
MQIGFVGLGRMGGNMVARIKRHSDHAVVAFDPDQKAREDAFDMGVRAVVSLEDLARALKPPRTIWLMVPAGVITQQAVDALAGLLEGGDTVVDGGNSKWTEDQARGETLAAKGIHYVDVGVSGGVWGLREGYCMMVGGPDEAVERLRPILDVLAPPPMQEHGPGWGHMGPTGSGHYVKMVHNGIEYGLMQAYAEGFDLFDKAPFELDNAQIAHLWMQGSVVRSWLCGLAAGAFEQEGNDLAALSGHTSDSGEGRWTIEEAMNRDVPTPVITAALYARFYSRGEGDFTHRLLAALRAQFGGHATKPAADG